MNDNEIWCDCTLCKYFKKIKGLQACMYFDIVGLPEMFAIGTSKKCCSSFHTNLKNIKMPDLTKMEFGILYFYDPRNPKKLIEDIDL